MDRAGRHRRLAVALPIFATALVILAIDNVANRHVMPGSWLPHLMLAACLAWILFSVLDSGRLTGRTGVPHPSLFAAVAGLSGLAGAAIRGPGWWCCQLLVMVGGVSAMVCAVVLFVGAERRGGNPAMPAGRLLLSVGAALVAHASLDGLVRQLVNGEVAGIGQTVGFGLLGMAGLMLAVHEGRLAIRLVRTGFAR